MGETRGHVFVVDDDPAFLNAVTRLIRVCGFGVTACASISELRGHLPLPPQSCVLADVLLDGESGLDIPGLLTAQNETAPVLFMSATDDEAVIRDAGRNSLLPCLRKPFEVQDLIDVFDKVFCPANQPSHTRPT